MTTPAVSDREAASADISVTALFEQYGTYCREIAFRILRDNDDVTACLNDVLVRVAQAARETEIADMKYYIAAATRNTAVNLFNKRKTAPHTVIFEELEECFGSDETDSTTDAIVIRDTINAFLTALPPTERWVFLRRYWHMDHIKDIAHKCGKQEAAVRMMLSRTRKKLKDLLEKEGIEV